MDLASGSIPHGLFTWRPAKMSVSTEQAPFGDRLRAQARPLPRAHPCGLPRRLNLARVNLLASIDHSGETGHPVQCRLVLPRHRRGRNGPRAARGTQYRTNSVSPEAALDGLSEPAQLR